MSLPDWFHDLAARLSNAGRWGADDRIGTINFIDDEARRRAAACITKGKAFSLALPLDAMQGIQTGIMPLRINPLRTMTQINLPLLGDPSAFCTSDDIVTMGLQAATHWDGLGHVSYDGKLYNGVAASTITEFGSTVLGIHNIATMVSRGVLLDVARALGVPRLEASYPITAADLDAAEALARTEVLPGDIVLVRTGQMEFLTNGDKPGYGQSSPGLTVGTAQWFRDRDVAAVATDTLPLEVIPCEDPTVFLPVHLLHLVAMGMTQGQNFVLDELALDCAADGVYTFFLDASPQPFVNAVGSPVNPVAIK